MIQIYKNHDKTKLHQGAQLAPQGLHLPCLTIVWGTERWTWNILKDGGSHVCSPPIWVNFKMISPTWNLYRKTEVKGIRDTN